MNMFGKMGSRNEVRKNRKKNGEREEKGEITE